MKTFADYFTESARTHKFVVKFAIKPDENQVLRIESRLKSYGLQEMTAPVMVHDETKDFIGIKNRNVHSMDVVLGRPATQYMLLQDLQSACGISESLLAVRSADEPIEIYSQQDVWKRETDTKAREDGFEPAARLSTDRFYSDEEQPDVGELFGNQYNQRLLQYLAGVAKSRPSSNVEPAAPLFGWIQMEDVEPGTPLQDTSNFNAHIKDAPSSVPVPSETPPVDPKNLYHDGTMVDDSVPVVKFFKNKETGATRNVRKPLSETK